MPNEGKLDIPQSSCDLPPIPPRNGLLPGQKASCIRHALAKPYGESAFYATPEIDDLSETTEIGHLDRDPGKISSPQHLRFFSIQTVVSLTPRDIWV